MSHATRLAGARQRIREAVHGGAEVAALLEVSADAISSLVSWDAMFLSGADPQTGQFTATTCVRELPPEMCAPWMRNEFLEPDVNKFPALRRGGAATLSEATQGHRMLSPRYRDIYRPYGFGHELRAALADGTGCWGYLTLIRAAGAPDFAEHEVELMHRLAPAIAQAVRAGHQSAASPAPVTPGVITIDREGTVLSMTDAARESFSTICAGSMHAVATAAFAQADGRATPPAHTRVRTSDRRWLSISGDVVRDEAGQAVAAAVVVDAARPAQLLPVLAAAYGITPRESEVLELLARGASTSDIAGVLSISGHTVRDYVRSLFGKTGVSSRGELVHLLLGTGT